MLLENTGWIHLAQDCAKCKAPVTAVNILLSQKTGISWPPALPLASPGLLHSPCGKTLVWIREVVRCRVTRSGRISVNRSAINVAGTTLARIETVSQILLAESENVRKFQKTSDHLAEV